MENDLLKNFHDIVHKWANAVLTPIHTVAITQTVMFCKVVLMSYVRTDTQIPKQYLNTYDGGGTWKPVRKKDGQTRSRPPNKLNTRSTRGILSYLR